MNDEIQIDSCDVCKKNPCVCSDKVEKSDPKTVDEDSKNDEKHVKAKPPRISWI
jgi:hypothetical protein